MSAPANSPVPLSLDHPGVFRQLVESAPDAIIIAGADGSIVLVNRLTEEMFGYGRNELIGQPVEILVPARFRGGHKGHRDSYFAMPHTRRMGEGLQLFAARKDGSEFPAEISLSPMETPEGRVVTAVIRDISDRIAIQNALEAQAAELRRSNAELEQFAYVASHDLQEPLRMVASYAQLLARRYRGKLDHDADEFIEFIVDGAARMQDLINDLLAYSRVGTQGRPLQRTDADAVVQRVVRNLGVAIEDAQAEVQWQDLPEVSADERQLAQLFQNLIANAVKFRGEAAPVVQIEAAAEEAMVRFSVRDNGIGMDPEYLQRIFLLFQRLHSKREYPGTGIGLAICKKIVERHGGRIWVESAPGAGSTFYFTLPTVQHEE